MKTEKIHGNSVDDDENKKPMDVKTKEAKSTFNEEEDESTITDKDPKITS